MGNITSLNGEVYTWTAGRQLSRLTKADNSYIDYFYDDNGQLSMYKQYNADNTLESGAEYFREGTRLIAVRSINSETSEAEPVFMRIIYDADGEALGFLLNDAMPFLYTKNILGDVTGVVYYETGEYLFRYAYDAYGNYELIPCGNGTAAQILAIIYHSLNPITYRGYVFTPAIGISHYLGSRFYSPLLCRFMNADVLYDTKNGVIGTNRFAYCDNCPIMFSDEEGTIPKLFTKRTTITVLIKKQYPFYANVNIYGINSKLIPHADLTIDGLIYTYGRYWWSNPYAPTSTISKENARLIVADAAMWITSEKKERRNKVTSYNIGLTEEEYTSLGTELLLFLLINCKIFKDRTENHNGAHWVIYDITKSKYKNYSLLNRNCSVFVRDMLYNIIPERFSKAMQYAVGHNNINSINTPSNLEKVVKYINYV